MRVIVVIVGVLLGACSVSDDRGYPIGVGVCGDGEKAALEGCDDGNRIGGDGCSAVCELEPRVQARWSIATYDGAVVGCPAGDDRVDLRLTDGHAAAFPCADGAGTLVLPFDDRAIVRATLAVVSSDHSSTYTTSLPSDELFVVGARVSFPLYTDAAYFHLSWIGDAAGDPACKLTLTATSKTSSFAMTWTPDCGEWEARELLPIDEYTLTFSGVDAAGLLTSTPIDLSLTIANELVELGTAGLHH